MTTKKIKPQVLAIVGPTASGKSDLAVLFAKKIGGEVISADSRQVYRGLDIGAGKITKKEMRGVRHHLLDVSSPKKTYSVADFIQDSEKAIEDILKRGRVPIICGGTGFYIDALLLGKTLPDVPPNKTLREKLNKKSVAELFEMLKKLDPKRAGLIDSKNKVRLVRALEIAKAIGKAPKIKEKQKYDVLWIGLKPSDDVLRKKIHTRLLSRIKKGMVAEVKNLHENGLSWKRMEELGLEYRYLARYLQNKISKKEMFETLEKEIWHYAKRQMTWFKRNPSIKWFDPKDNKMILDIPFL